MQQGKSCFRNVFPVTVPIICSLPLYQQSSPFHATSRVLPWDTDVSLMLTSIDVVCVLGAVQQEEA